jgi:hypothetical protein
VLVCDIENLLNVKLTKEPKYKCYVLLRFESTRANDCAVWAFTSANSLPTLGALKDNFVLA